MNQLLSSTKFALLSFRRNPAGTFFTVIFPVLFLVIFGFIFGNEEIDSSGAKVSTFIVPGILGLSIVSATLVNQAITQVFRREAGQLKRLRGTPLSPLTYIGAQVIASMVIVTFMTLLVTVIGRLFFGVSFQFETLGVFIPTVLLGTLVFSALGLALTAIIPNEDSAPAVTNGIVLPLYFISDVFVFSEEGASGFIETLGNIFPIKHMVQALQPSYDPFLQSVEVPWTNWAVMAAWGVAGVVLALRFFRWTPQTERR